MWQLLKLITSSNNATLSHEHGEYKLNSVKQEIARRADPKFKNCSYNADGAHTMKIDSELIELSIIEISGPYEFKDDGRTTKDHIKGGFGTLSLLHHIAHLSYYGSFDTFSSIRVYYIHAFENKLRLWSLEQVAHSVCIMNLIHTATIPTDLQDSQINMRDVTNLLWLYKICLDKSIVSIKNLQKEHSEVELRLAKGTLNLSNTSNLVTSLAKNTTLKVKGDYIRRYHELQIHSTV